MAIVELTLKLYVDTSHYAQAEVREDGGPETFAANVIADLLPRAQLRNDLDGVGRLTTRIVDRIPDDARNVD